MRFRLAPRSMTFDNLELYKFQRISRDFVDFGCSNSYRSPFLYFKEANLLRWGLSPKCTDKVHCRWNSSSFRLEGGTFTTVGHQRLNSAAPVSPIA